MNSVIIVAGGESNRFGGKIPKQFVHIQDKELLSYSVNTFQNHPKINEIIIASHQDWMEHVMKKYPDCRVVNAGKRRQDSSLNGLKATSAESINILFHDAARPFISNNIISKCILALNTHDASVPIISTTDSLVKLNGKIASYIDRSDIKILQTPQCFNKLVITKVLESNLPGTDEIGMLLRLYPDSKIKFIKGSINNIKITTQNDLNYFTKIII